ncbi:hypothetical protein PG993_009103 [Apiospora rasikravindrae]|uniref:Uncharacterized protein n=1 Tax=Apiospora rasikravindrae TaxID=990691 RepID=A0ABR1SIE9_9PEZI
MSFQRRMMFQVLLVLSIPHPRPAGLGGRELSTSKRRVAYLLLDKQLPSFSLGDFGLYILGKALERPAQS